MSDVGVLENFKERGGNYHKVKNPLFKKFFCSPPLSLKILHIAHTFGAIRNMQAICQKNTIVILENFHGVVVYFNK